MGKGYYHTSESVEEYIRMADGHDGRELILQLKQYLKSGSTLLEIGSGPGTDWELLNEDFQVTGSDNSSEFIKRLIQSNPGSKFLTIDARTLMTNEKYNGIYSNKVLHHLKTEDLIASIERQYEILNSEGIVCHSFWKGEGSEVFKGLYVKYHSESDIRKYFGAHFEILMIQAYQEFEESDSLFMIAKKKN